MNRESGEEKQIQLERERVEGPFSCIATGDKSFSQELFITADYPWAAMSGKNFL